MTSEEKPKDLCVTVSLHESTISPKAIAAQNRQPGKVKGMCHYSSACCFTLTKMLIQMRSLARRKHCQLWLSIEPMTIFDISRWPANFESLLKAPQP